MQPSELKQQREAAYDRAAAAAKKVEAAEKAGNPTEARSAVATFDQAIRDFDSLTEKIDAATGSRSDFRMTKVGAMKLALAAADNFLSGVEPPIAATRQDAARKRGEGWHDPRTGARALGKEENLFDYAVERGGDAGPVRDGLTLGRVLRAKMLGKDADTETRALSQIDLSTGGALSRPLTASFIDRLRRQSAVFQAGAKTFPMEAPEHRLARLTTGVTAAWRGEGATIPESDPSFDGLFLKAHSLGVIVKSSRELIQDAVNGPEIIETELRGALAEEIDRAALLGSGVGEEPLGLRNDADINSIASIGALVWDDLIDGEKKVRDNNDQSTGIIYSPREWSTLAKAKGSANDHYLEPPAAIREIPRFVSTAIPVNEGGGSNESRLYLGNWPNLIVGIRLDVTIIILQELYAATGQVGALAFFRGDVAVARPKSFCMLSGITA